MKLNYAIICENAFTDDKGRLNIIQTFEKITASAKPFTHAKMTVVTNFSLDEEDKGKQYTQKLEVVERETNKVISQTEITINTNKTVNNMNFLSYFIGTTFPNFGYYDAKIQVNGKDYGKVSFLTEKE